MISQEEIMNTEIVSELCMNYNLQPERIEILRSGERQLAKVTAESTIG